MADFADFDETSQVSLCRAPRRGICFTKNRKEYLLLRHRGLQFWRSKISKRPFGRPRGPKVRSREASAGAGRVPTKKEEVFLLLFGRMRSYQGNTYIQPTEGPRKAVSKKSKRRFGRPWGPKWRLRAVSGYPSGRSQRPQVPPGGPKVSLRTPWGSWCLFWPNAFLRRKYVHRLHGGLSREPLFFPQHLLLRV